MNILLSGYLDRNFGDDIMLRIVANELREHKLFISEKRKELLLPFKDISNIFDLEKSGEVEIDFALRVTGSGFMVTNKIGIYYAIKRFLECKKNKNNYSDLCIIGCNIGPFFNRFSAFLSKQDMKQYKIISTREKFSYEYVKKNIKNVKAYCFPDIVFSLPEKWIPDVKGKEECLGISAYRNMQKSALNYVYYKKMAQLADKYIKQTGKKVLLFAFDMENENDLAAAYTIKNFCEEKDLVEIIVHDDNGDNIIKSMARCKCVIGTRFHSIVLALRMKIAFVPIIYSNKTKNMLDDLGYSGEKFHFDKIADIDTDKLITTIIKGLDPVNIKQDVFDGARGHIEVFKEHMLDKKG